MENGFLRIFYIYNTRHFWSIVISLFLFTLLSFNSISSATTTDCITMQDGSVFTGTFLPSTVKFKTKYGETEVHTENIVSFSRDALVLKDQSKLIGNFSSGSITIETSNKKLDFPATEVIGLTTKLASMRDEKLSTTIQNQGLSSSMKLNREDAKRILVSEDLTISIKWSVNGICQFGKIALHLRDKSPSYSYLSCLADKNLFTGTIERFDFIWPGMGGDVNKLLTETGTKHLNKDLNLVFKIIVNEITGIKFVDKSAQVFFNGTVASSDNPFNQCFESCWDIQSFLNEPYALFELFDDGWRFKELNTGGTFNSLKELQQPHQEKKMPTKEPYKELTKFEKLLVNVKDADVFNAFQRVVPYRYDDVWGTVVRILEAQKATIVQSDKDAGIVVTDTTDYTFDNNEKMFYIIEKYYISIEKINDVSSKLNLKLISYYFYKKDKIVRPLVKYDYHDNIGIASSFLERIEKELKRRSK